MSISKIVADPQGRPKLSEGNFYVIQPNELSGANSGQRPDLIQQTWKVYQLSTDPQVLLKSNGSQIVPVEDAASVALSDAESSPVFIDNMTRLLVDADGASVSVAGGGSTIPEYATFSALPGAATLGDRAIVLAAQGVYFVNRKDSGLYRYNGASWMYLGALPEGYFTDNVTGFFDDADPTKKGGFELSGITPGTSRVLSWPDKNGTIACLDDMVPGPQGIQGIQGIQGPQGPQGIPGTGGGGSSSTVASGAVPQGSFNQADIIVTDALSTDGAPVDARLAPSGDFDADELLEYTVIGQCFAGSIVFTIGRRGPIVGTFTIHYKLG